MTQPKVHCVKCGTDIIVSSDGQAVRFCRQCGTDFQSFTKKAASSSREPWIQYCVCGTKCFEDAPICAKCGANLSGITLKPIPTPASSKNEKMALTQYVAVFGAMHLISGAAAHADVIADAAGNTAKGIGGFLKELWDIFT